MKKILKYLLVPVFVGSTALTVVACGTTQPAWNQDILNSAVGRMQNHTFNMNEDLNLAALPEEGTKYSDLSVAVRSRINGYYSDLVKSSISWDNPSIDVSLSGQDDSPFLKKYGDLVESRLTLTAHLTYRNLNADTTIVVKINNDQANPIEKINAIGATLGTYLDTNPVFYFQTLFKNHLRSDDSSFKPLEIEAPLRTALFKETTEENPIPVIDVAEVDIAVLTPESPAEIYALDSPAIDTIGEIKVIKGKLSNLSLMLHYQGFSTILTGKTLAVAQRISDASNQITSMLNQGQQALQFKQATLPEITPGAQPPTLQQYFDGTGASLKGDIQKKMFDIISKFYPTENMSGTIDPWASAQISFPNATSSPYIKIDDTHGYFLANIRFLIKFDNLTPNPTTIDSLVYNIKLNLTQGSTS